MSIRTRDAIEIKEYYKAEQERIEAPIRGQLSQHEQLLKEQRELELEAVTSGKPDPAFLIPDDALNLHRSKEEQADFVNSECRTFIHSTPEYAPYRIPENASLI